MELKDRILVYRAKNNISQKEMAKLCKISTQTLWSIEKGDQVPSAITRTKIELVVGKEEDND